MEQLDLIICTKDRPYDLERLFKSIQIQTFMPRSIIVVDGSDHPIKEVVEKFPDIPTDYVAVRPPSLPKQRNVGIGRLPQDLQGAQWVGFLDDDLVLEQDALEQVIKASREFSAQRPLGGIGMMITNTPEIRIQGWRRLFLLDDGIGGKLTCSGINTLPRKREDTVEVEWLCGGATFWHKKVLDEYSFDEWFEGIGYLEDVDFSYTASKKYALVLCGKSRVQHLDHPIPKNKQFSMGVWQVVALWYFVRKAGDFNPFATLWSMLGLSLNSFIMGIYRPAGHRLRRCAGSLYGIGLVLTGKAMQRRPWHK